MLKKACSAILTSSLNIQPDESVLVVTDRMLEDIGHLFFDVANDYCKESMLLTMRERDSHGEEPPSLVSNAMMNADVIIIPTYKSLSHTMARKNACNNGARVASMPKINHDMLMRVSKTDFEQTKRDSERWCKLLTDASSVRITTGLGTDISFSIEGRIGVPDSGIYHNKGDFGNIPAGEAYVAPVEGTANGTIIIDASMATVGLLKDPIKLKIDRGIATEITGGVEADKLISSISTFGEDARNLAEFAIGLNPAAIISGDTLEDEKVKNTIHVAIGDNSTFGGSVSSPSHLDGIIRNPTVAFDGKIVINEGKWLI